MAIGEVHAATVAWRRVGDAQPEMLASWPGAPTEVLGELVERSLEEGRELAVAVDVLSSVPHADSVAPRRVARATRPCQRSSCSS